MPALFGARKSVLFGGNPEWTPAQLFSGGEEGFFVDFTRPYLQQTIGGGGGNPSDGGAIGYALDQSGNGNHFTSSASNTPTYNATKQAATFAGSEELHSVANPVVWNTSGNNNATVIVGCEKSSAATGQVIIETGAIYTGVNYMACLITDEPGALPGGFGFNAHHYTTNVSGYAQDEILSTDGTYNHIRMTMNGNTPTSAATLMPVAEVNGVDPNSRTATTGAPYGGNGMTNSQWFVGARNASSVWYTGNICYIFAIDRYLTTAENDLMEAWAMKRMGISF